MVSVCLSSRLEISRIRPREIYKALYEEKKKIYGRAVKCEDPLTLGTTRERGDYEPEENIGVLHIEC